MELRDRLRRHGGRPGHVDALALTSPALPEALAPFRGGGLRRSQLRTLCTDERFIHRSTWRSTPRVVHRVWRDGTDPNRSDLRFQFGWDACDGTPTPVTTPV